MMATITGTGMGITTFHYLYPEYPVF